LEEIVGNIFDEHDEEEKEIEKINGNTYLIDGTLSLDKVKELLEIDLPTDEYDTLSGFVMPTVEPSNLE
jgi:putative hemolysin